MELNYKKLNELEEENNRLRGELEARQKKPGKSAAEAETKEKIRALVDENRALREELEEERYRADRYADFCAAAMDSGFQRVENDEGTGSL